MNTRPHKNNVFAGPEALNDYLNPAKQLATPLVEVSRIIDADPDFHVFAKLMYLSPLLNSKSYPVYTMLKEAYLNSDTLVEATSGNTGANLMIYAERFGIKKVVLVVRRDTAPSKLENLRVAGAEIVFPEKGETTTAAAKRLAKQHGWHNLNQYENDANPAAFEKYLGPELWQQTEGKITVLAASLGTTGTLVGCNHYFLKKSRKSRRTPKTVKMVGGMCDDQDAVPGARSRKRLREISFNWEDPSFHLVDLISAPESYRASLKLYKKAGIVAGPSSGLALVALQRFYEHHKKAGTLDRFRNDDGEIVAVFICPDTLYNYLEKYSTHLTLE